MRIQSVAVVPLLFHALILHEVFGFIIPKSTKLYRNPRSVSKMSATDESMHAEYDALASHLLQVSAQRDSPYWVGIAGGPGSGKSTLSAAVASRINTLTGLDVCVVLPMDGFHYRYAVGLV